MFVLPLLVLFAAADGYAKPELLVEPDQLPETRIVLDVSTQDEYRAGHIPGAIWVDGTYWEKTFGSGDKKEEWSKIIGKLGIDGSIPVIVYDRHKSRNAARVWWILRYWGVEKVAILNGGFKGYGERKTVQAETTPKEIPFRAVPHAERHATQSEILKLLEKRELQIVDARSEAEHCGEEKLRNKRAGAIPGAKNLDWSLLIDHKTDRFLPAPKIKELLNKSGIDLQCPTVTHCQSGGRAAVMAFALELVGAEKVKNYHRSWSEWGNSPDTPIVKPEKRKQP